MNPARTSEHRPFRAAAIALLFATGLAACGGGSSIDIGNGGGGNVAGCLSIVGGGDGYALGTCANPAMSVFQKPDVETVTIGGADSYILALDFPASLPASADVIQEFVSTNKTPDVRNVLGELEGQAYEAPYVALTDFFRAWTEEKTPAVGNEDLALKYANFGTWERFPSDASPGEGYFGVWYGKRSSLIRNTWRSGAASYSGWMVGIIGPGSAGSLARLTGFSGRVTIKVDFAGNIESASISDLKQSYGTPLIIESLPLQPLVLVQSSGSTPGSMAGSIGSAGGTGATAVGTFELNYFGPDGDFAGEIAGRLRFTTSNGLIAIGSFGAQFVPPAPG